MGAAPNHGEADDLPEVQVAVLGPPAHGEGLMPIPAKRDDFPTRRDAYLTSRGLRSKKFDIAMSECMQKALVRTGVVSGREGHGYRRDVLDSPHCTATIIGGFMDNDVLLLKAINQEVEESKAILQKLANDIRAVNDIVQPALLEHAQQLRSSRMAVVSELQASLVAMKDVRKFFLESDYDVEMNRLERFVRVCKEVQALKAAGVFDAMVSSAIRLAVQEEGSGE